MKKSCKEIFHITDIFGQPVNLKLNKKDAITSSFGGIITILNIIFIVFTFGYYSINCLFKKDPQVKIITQFYTSVDLFINQDSEKQFSDYVNTTKINSTALCFKIGSNAETQLQISTYMTVNSNHKIFQLTDNMTKLYNNQILTDVWYCLDYENSDDLLNLYVPLTIYYCKDKDYCKSRDESNKFIEGNQLGVSLLLVSYSVDAQNYTDPFPPIKSLYSQSFIKDTSIFYYTSFTIHELNTDDGFLFSNNKKYNETSFPIIEKLIKPYILPGYIYPDVLWGIQFVLSGEKIK